jgi:hypothetical protein
MATFKVVKTGTPLTFPRLSYGNPEPSSKRGNALRRQWNVQPFAQQSRERQQRELSLRARCGSEATLQPLALRDLTNVPQ